MTDTTQAAPSANSESATSEAAPEAVESQSLGDVGSGELDPVESAIKALHELGNEEFPGEGEKSEIPPSEQIPTEMKGENDDVPANESGEKEAGAAEDSGHGLDLDKINDRERAIWKERKKNRDVLSEEREKSSALEKRIAELEANPVHKKLESVNDSEEEAETDDFDDLVNELMGKKDKDGKSLTEEKVREIITEFKTKEAEENNVQLEELEQEEAMLEFSEEVKAFVDDNSVDFPLVGPTGSQELVIDVIAQDYRNKKEEYGEEYALGNLMTNKEAAGRVQKHLEGDIKEMLKSEPMRKLIQTYLNEHGNPETRRHQSPGTMTEDFSSPSGSGELDEDERTRRAIAALS